jgi:hypothetical protein
MERKEIFTHIYNNSKEIWHSEESRSGIGSTLAQTDRLRVILPKYLDEFGIKSMLDIPCGDHNWMRLVDLSGIEYIGADIVDEVISENKRKYDRDFRVMDLLTDKLPCVDLVFCRDCLGHFSINDVKKALNNIKESGSKYLMTRTFIGYKKPDWANRDITTGEWTLMDLSMPPYMLNPIKLSEERNFGDAKKCIAIYDISKLPKFL